MVVFEIARPRTLTRSSSLTRIRKWALFFQRTKRTISGLLETECTDEAPSWNTGCFMGPSSHRRSFEYHWQLPAIPELIPVNIKGDNSGAEHIPARAPRTEWPWQDGSWLAKKCYFCRSKCLQRCSTSVLWRVGWIATTPGHRTLSGRCLWNLREGLQNIGVEWTDIMGYKK